MSNSKDNVPAVLQEIASQIPSDYSVMEFLGEGAHGIVLKARQKTLQQLVALKIIKTDGSTDMQKQILRMQNEAKVLARLNHQNIVKVYQMGACSDGTPFLVCEYIEGITLAQMLALEEILSPRKILEIFSQILDALECAHSNGLLHRDLKPGNVMIVVDPETGSSLVKLLDFGIARELDASEGQLNLTRTIQLSGSAPYMSPEQCRGDKLDARADLYSVACMLYECLSGKPPFVGETPMHTRYLQIHQEASLPAQNKFENTSSRAAVFGLALQTLAKNPNARPASASEFKAKFIQALPSASKRNSWTVKSGRRFSLWMLFLIVAAILSCCLLWIENFRTRVNVPAKFAVPVRMQTSTRQLSQLLSESERFSYINSAENIMNALKLREEILARLKLVSLRDKGILFIGYRSVANIEMHLGLQESESTWKKALSFCKLADGQYTVEASDCYENLAFLYLQKKRYAEAEEMIKTGLEHAALREKQTIILDLPSILDVRTGIHHIELLRDRATLESSRGQYELALKDLLFVEDAKFKADELRQAVDFEGAIISLWARIRQNEKIKPFLMARIEGFDKAVSADAAEKADAFLRLQAYLKDYPDLMKRAQERYKHYSK